MACQYHEWDLESRKCKRCGYSQAEAYKMRRVSAEARVGIEIKAGAEEIPIDWPAACVAISANAMRAMGYLEAGRPDLALPALNEARSQIDMLGMSHVKMASIDEYIEADGIVLHPCPWGHVGEASVKTERDGTKVAAWVECGICDCRGVWAGWYKDELLATKWASFYWNERRQTAQKESVTNG